MYKQIKNRIKYLTLNCLDEEWGIAISTVGHQSIDPLGNYPSGKHPESYNFSPQKGRILNEYQLVYITRGSGYFSSDNTRHKHIYGGTMILLFPGEWHNYYPDPQTGWDEYWVGFKGKHMEKYVEKGFFSTKEPLLDIGLSATIINLYEDIINFIIEEKTGYQEMISGMVHHLLSTIYYKQRNNAFKNSYIVDKINEARLLMKETIERPSSPQLIAEKLGLSYSWFRRMFKEYTGISPTQYQLQQKMLKAKELLINSHLNIAEIAYKLNFENAGQFSTFFKKREGVPPSQFRDRIH